MKDPDYFAYSRWRVRSSAVFMYEALECLVGSGRGEAWMSPRMWRARSR
jgi:hypothetical protein